MTKETKQPDEEFAPVNQKPFWKPEKEGEQIRGFVGNSRELSGEYGVQTVIDVGDYSVGISAGLKPLASLDGQFVRVTYEGFDKSKKGRDFKKFLIEIRK